MKSIYLKVSKSHLSKDTSEFNILSNLYFNKPSDTSESILKLIKDMLSQDEFFRFELLSKISKNICYKTSQIYYSIEANRFEIDFCNSKIKLHTNQTHTITLTVFKPYKFETFHIPDISDKVEFNKLVKYVEFEISRYILGMDID